MVYFLGGVRYCTWGGIKGVDIAGVVLVMVYWCDGWVIYFKCSVGAVGYHACLTRTRSRVFCLGSEHPSPLLHINSHAPGVMKKKGPTGT